MSKNLYCPKCSTEFWGEIKNAKCGKCGYKFNTKEELILGLTKINKGGVKPKF